MKSMIYDKERIKILKIYIRENIKTLEEKKAIKIDKEIARMLIGEEVEALIRGFLYTKIMGTTKQVLEFEKDMREVREYLFTYLLKVQHDIEITKVYENMLFIV